MWSSSGQTHSQLAPSPRNTATTVASASGDLLFVRLAPGATRSSG